LGKGIEDRLAKDIQKAFPGLQGFSTRKVWRLRAFYLAYAKEVTILPQPVAELDGVNLDDKMRHPDDRRASA